MRTAIALAALLLGVAGAAAAPAGWKPAMDHKMQCVAVVPGNWTPGIAGIGMHAPAGASKVLVSVSRLPSLAAIKANMPKVFKVTKVYEDSAARYWIAYSVRAGVTNWYVATQQPGLICSMNLDFDSALSEVDAKTVATSLKKH